jgi:hypothetical protein
MPDATDAALLDLVRRLGPDEALRLLRLTATPAAVARAERLAAAERVRGWLQAGESRAVIARRLMAAGASRATAYRTIDRGLSHGPRDGETNRRHAAAMSTNEAH